MGTRRGARALMLSAILAAFLGATPVASAQQPAIGIRLISQTPWTTPKHPKLEITFEATNEGTQVIGSLSAGITIGPAIRARLSYEQTLTNGPGQFPIFAATVPQAGELAPGGTRRFSLSVDVSGISGLSQVDSLVYPSQIGLLSAGIPVATANTAEINFVPTLEPPLLVSWWAEATAPIAFDPSGLLADPRFEASIARGGPLRSEVDALQQLATGRSGPAVEIAVEPALLEQISRMVDGYQRVSGESVARGEAGASDADQLLVDFRAAAAGRRTEVSVMPFSAPVLPTLMVNPLIRDLDRQLSLGQDTVAKELGVATDPSISRPPAGALDDASVQALSGAGIRTLLANPDTVARPSQPNDFAPPPTTELATRGEKVSLVLPDPNVASLLGDSSLLADPVRAAQATLGEIATIWREEPGKTRGIAIDLPASLPAGLWGPLVQRLGHAPFLKTVRPSTFVADIHPEGAQGTLSSPSPARFSRSYASAIRTEHNDIASYRSMLTAASPLPDRLDRNLLFAEAGQYVGDEADGRAWIDGVRGYLDGVFTRLAPNTSQSFTLTSQTGKVPIRMGDPGSVPLKVVVKLQSSRFSFPGGDSQTMTLTRPNQVVEFGVRATTSGQGVIQVIIYAPTGRAIGSGTLLVRSTAVSRIALIITGAAALALAILYSRRLFRRPAS